MQPTNCTGNEFFAIKESYLFKNTTKRIKLNLDAENKKLCKNYTYELRLFKGQK